MSESAPQAVLSAFRWKRRFSLDYVIFWAALAMLVAFATPEAWAQSCSRLQGGSHSGNTWMIVAKGDEAVEYRVKSREPGWDILGFQSPLLFCTRCGQARLSTALDPDNLTIDDWPAIARQRWGAQPMGDSRSIEIGAFKGAVIRVARPLDGKTIFDFLVVEMADGCAHLSLLVQLDTQVDRQRFSDPGFLATAIAVEQISRGPAAGVSIK